MPTRTLTTVLALAALATSPGLAGAADTVIVPGVQAPRITALDGTVVWVSGAFPNQMLMQRNPDGTVLPVTGAPTATYFSIDLGHDARGALVLTYARCAGTKSCKVFTDDLAGRRNTFKRLAPPGCALTAAPSRWGARVAYGLGCTKVVKGKRIVDPARSGLFVRNGTGGRRRLKLPPDAMKFHSTRIGWVDLRERNVGAGTTDVFSYAFTQTIAGADLRARLVATSEGDSDANIRGLSLGTNGVLWMLVDALHIGDPNLAVISRLLPGGCSEFDTLANPAGPDEGKGYRAEALAVDGTTVYLYAPGTGIVVHDFLPARACA